MRYAAAAIALCLALAPGAASAQQLYRWTDASGRVHVTDTPPPPTAREVQKKAFKGSVVETDQLPFELSKAMKDAPVGPVKEIGVWNPAPNALLRQVSGAAEVPTLTVGGTVQKGFEQGAFDRALDIAGYPKTGRMPPRNRAAPSAPTGTDQTSAPAEEEQKPLGPYAPRFSGEQK